MREKVSSVVFGNIGVERGGRGETVGLGSANGDSEGSWAMGFG